MANKNRIKLKTTTAKISKPLISSEHGLQINSIISENGNYIFNMTVLGTKKAVSAKFTLGEILDTCDGLKALSHFNVKFSSKD